MPGGMVIKSITANNMKLSFTRLQTDKYGAALSLYKDRNMVLDIAFRQKNRQKNHSEKLTLSLKVII
jgi:hypothetical protein